MPRQIEARIVPAIVAMTLSILGTGLARSGAGPAASTHLVEIRGLEFLPSTLKLAPGDTVVWVNNDMAPHTVAAVDSAWQSERLEQGQRWTLVVQSEGEVPYFCTYHPTMRGASRRNDAARGSAGHREHGWLAR